MTVLKGLLIKMTGHQTNYSDLAVAILTFSLWGLLPVYWKLLSEVPPYEILANRTIWALVSMLIIIIFAGRLSLLVNECKQLLTNPKRILYLMASTLLLNFNGLIFIWAVNNDLVVESSLGFFMSPLCSVFVGVILLKERLTLWQCAAVLLAATGVIYLTLGHGSFPWVAVALALTMPLYAFCKKMTILSAINGIALEMAIILPLALIFLHQLHSKGLAYPVSYSTTDLFLVLSGTMSIIPMILFSYCINRLPLTQLGILQYINPAISFILGVFVYDEDFSQSHAIAFSFILSGLLLYTIATTHPMIRLERRLSGLWR